MSGRRPTDWRPEVSETLRALGGQGTLGDLVVVTGLPKHEVERALDALLATDWAHVKVAASGDVIYHLVGEARGHSRRVGSGRRFRPRRPRGEHVPPSRSLRVGFDRKTLRLIRAREGVLSLAELVEHTGLPLREAETEMNRLAESYGGVWYPSLDGHAVCAFPELMISAHGRFGEREPRPAWVRFEDPVWRARAGSKRDSARALANALGLCLSTTAPWLVRDAGPGLVLAVIAAAAVGLVVFGSGLLQALEHSAVLRYWHAGSLRRYALGHVIQTALAGKGVVSLDRTVRYLQARAGSRRVSRSGVEVALRELAREFDAPITEADGDLFFGFRNVKRQFLASHLARKHMRLNRTACGETVFDSADPPSVAGERELAAFDRLLSGVDGTALPATAHPPPP